MYKWQETLYTCTLEKASIDEMSEKLGEYLQDFEISSKDVYRYRLCVESVMEIWAGEMEETTVCRLSKTQRFRKTSFILEAEGKRVDPIEYQDELLLSVCSNANMAVALGLPAEYQYNNGKNQLKLSLPGKKVNSLMQVLVACVAAIVIGIGLRGWNAGVAAAVSEILLTPLADTITDLLHLIAGPLIFVSIVSGITGIGDAASLAKIGGTLIQRFVLMTFLCAVIVWISVSWITGVQWTGNESGAETFSEILRLILDMVPEDIVSPFQSGNAVQIIFLALCIGIGCILLNDVVPDTIKVVSQINLLVQKLMMGVSRLLPLYVFLSVANLMMVSEPAELMQIVLPILIISGISLVLPIIYGIYASIRTHVPLKELFIAQLPTFLLALTTASSSAAYPGNVECCIQKLHIDRKLVCFGVPIGQVLFMPAATIDLIVLPLFMAAKYGIVITPEVVLMMLVTATIVAIANPPIPGGGIAAMMIMFSQLGIPLSAMAIGAAVMTFTDYPITASDVACLQQELLINARKLGMNKGEDLSE